MTRLIRRMNERIMKKIRGSLQLKLLLPVLMVVVVIFLTILFTCIVYYKNAYLESEINYQKKQMDKAIYGISTMQSTIENVSKQIVVSEVVQGKIRNPVKTSADYFVDSKKIRNALGTYTFIMDYIQEIMIYTKEGNTYSSSMLRDDFEPLNEQWYLDFKQSGAKKGYTKIHTGSVYHSGRKRQLISYVLTYYSLTDYHQELGNLVISLDYESVQKMATLDMEFLEGYAFFDQYGEKVLGQGTIDMSYEDILNVSGNQFTDESGNIFLISKELENDWVMVTEISGHLLERQIMFVEILIICVFIVLALLIVFTLSYNVRKVVEPINRLSLVVEQFGKGNFDVSVEVSTGDEVEILANAFNKMGKDVQHYTEMSVEHEKIIRKSKVDQLLLQINPHFIYNTLNSIVYMARIEKNQNIETFVNAFISLLQNTLRVENEIYTSLGEEIRNVENYLILQKYRYMDKFEAEIKCQEELRAYLIPKVILQPIVENAIFHGIAPMEEKGKLKISVEAIKKKLRVIVEDDGVGMPDERIRQVFESEHVGRNGMKKIGVVNVQRRIKEICGDEYGLHIESQEGVGTRVVIDLPLKMGSDIGKEKKES